jgi:Family of unknown function (DUF695)
MAIRASPTDSRWNVLQGKNADQPMLVRKNETAKVLKAHGGYRARVGIAVKLLEITGDGFPSPRELSVLNNLEDALALAFEAKQNAIHALTITTSGFLNFTPRRFSRIAVSTDGGTIVSCSGTGSPRLSVPRVGSR